MPRKNNNVYTLTTSAATNGYVYQDVWPSWNYDIYTGSAATATVTYTDCTTSAIWTDWNASYVRYVSVRHGQDEVFRWDTGRPWVAPTPEELQAAREETANRLRAAQVLRDEAEKRAEAILIASLTPEQAKQYKQHRYFEVFTAHGGKVRRYRLTHGWAGNVRLYEGERAVAKFCIHPQIQVPYADNLLAQKLMLEHDEERFHRVANRTDLVA